MRAYIKVQQFHYPFTVDEVYEISPNHINDDFINVYIYKDENYHNIPKEKVIMYNTVDNPEYFLWL